jgi:protein-tyrosine phosphatase
MAERMLRRHAEARGTAATISSAGLLEGGRSASDGSARVMSNMGIDLADHRSHQIDVEALDSADLVLAMELRHVREAALLTPDRLDRIYTLRELVGRGQVIGPRGERALDDWLTALAEGRAPGSLLGRIDLDVDDPYGGPAAGYDRTAAQLVDLTGTAADLLWGPVPDGVELFPDVPATTDASGRPTWLRRFTRR